MEIRKIWSGFSDVNDPKSKLIIVDYYFPNIVTEDLVFTGGESIQKKSINSGENALALLLRYFKLSQGDKVAIPAFVCSSVVKAVKKAECEPYYLDLFEHSYHTNYDLELLRKENVKAIILVHLYGQLHPQTEELKKFCNEHHIFLIHDAAQSYGINKKVLERYPIVYSFGPGKSSAAAKGAIIENVAVDDILKFTESPKYPTFVDRLSRKFFLDRMYEKRTGKGSWWSSKVDSLAWRFLNKRNDVPERMTNYQCKVAESVMALVDVKKQERKNRYQFLENILGNKGSIKVLKSEGDNLSFKIVVEADDQKKFASYLKQNEVPYYQLYEDLSKNEKINSLEYFNKMAPLIFEFSTEASIPMKEIERVGDVLANY